MLPSFPVLSNPSFQVSWKEGKGGEDKLRCVHAKSLQLFCATLWWMGYTLFTVRSHIPFHKSRSMEIYSVWRSGHKISLLVDTMYSFNDDLEVVRVCTKKKVVITVPAYFTEKQKQATPPHWTLFLVNASWTNSCHLIAQNKAKIYPLWIWKLRRVLWQMIAFWLPMTKPFCKWKPCQWKTGRFDLCWFSGSLAFFYKCSIVHPNCFPLNKRFRNYVFFVTIYFSK